MSLWRIRKKHLRHLLWKCRIYTSIFLSVWHSLMFPNLWLLFRTRDACSSRHQTPQENQECQDAQTGSHQETHRCQGQKDTRKTKNGQFPVFHLHDFSIGSFRQISRVVWCTRKTTPIKFHVILWLFVYLEIPQSFSLLFCVINE